MSDPDDKKTPDRRGLNPKLKSVENTSRDTETPMRPPADSTSVQHEEGRSWPVIWVIVTLICVVIAAYLLFW
ncbi:MAG: hypothetical protein Q4P24_11240 [Rhodobacterales bacterium]|nr:hypothetical protein [Rhodobacterales bacterium]